MKPSKSAYEMLFLNTGDTKKNKNKPPGSRPHSLSCQNIPKEKKTFAQNRSEPVFDPFKRLPLTNERRAQ